jgi:hypothetical protein
MVKKWNTEERYWTVLCLVSWLVLQKGSPVSSGYVFIRHKTVILNSHWIKWKQNYLYFVNFKRYGIRCSGSLFQDIFPEFVWNYRSALTQNSHNKTNKSPMLKLKMFKQNLSYHRCVSICPTSHPRLELRDSRIKFRLMENYDKSRIAVLVCGKFGP